MKELSADAVDYRNDKTIKKSAWYEDDVANELKRMMNNTAVQMNDRTFSGKDPVSIIAFLQNFKATCDAWDIHEEADVWLSK